MALYTKKLIMTAFHEMLEKQPFDKITVSALVKRAGISPNTFYYHYQDIYALLDAWLLDKAEEYCPKESHIDWRMATKEILHDCKDHPQLVYHLFDGLSRDRLERAIFSLTDDPFQRVVDQAAGDRPLSPERRSSIAAFCRYAYIGFVMRFFWNRMDSDIDAGVDRLGALFDTFLEGAVRQQE